MRALLGAAVILSGTAMAADEVSIERGRLVSIIGGCHDCHTSGYSRSGGVIDAGTALKGSNIGWRGPWGTTYAINLRRRAAEALSEDRFVDTMKTIKSSPPMPWYNVRAMPESDLRSLYRYIKSLGEPGENAPYFVAPMDEPKTAYIVLDPPQAAPACKRDFDCGIGQVCNPAGVCTAN